MKVCELIEELEKYDDDLEVVISNPQYVTFTVRSIEGPEDDYPEVCINVGDEIE